MVKNAIADIEELPLQHRNDSKIRLKSILVVDDEAGIRNFLQRGLAKRFGLVEVVEDVDSAEVLRQRCHFDLIIADIRLQGKSGVEWVTELREQGSQTSVIFITAHADLDTAIAALRAGAADFIMKPFRMEQILAAVEQCLERQQMQRENFVLRRQIEHIYDGAGMVGSCEVFKNVCEVIKRVAPMPSTVLIEGESGTGKEIAARAIHTLSGLSGSFVPINCGAISPELLESELFGHVRGAFTGALQAREGLFNYANGGTLFLDEIGEMPLSMQAHLLRVLEERRVRPVGSNREVPVDVRVIAATNRNLLDEVQKGNFREDLYYRLNVLCIRMPALRDRKEDLPMLARYFAETLAAELGVAVPEIGEAEIMALMEYDWPGNVRELKNVIERCLLLNTPPNQCVGSLGVASVSDEEQTPGEETLRLEAVEKRHILRVLAMEDGNKSAAARRLGISRKTLERKVREWSTS
ncbi:MAG TPA: sigma-54-dependent Fis family transcriptional regulator [Chromatiales bacterium]|nr:sigma-54-dependent Fis family transcriptional regulator [Chromatiales bacterium]